MQRTLCNIMNDFIYFGYYFAYTRSFSQFLIVSKLNFCWIALNVLTSSVQKSDHIHQELHQEQLPLQPNLKPHKQMMTFQNGRELCWNGRLQETGRLQHTQRPHLQQQVRMVNDHKKMMISEVKNDSLTISLTLFYSIFRFIW